MGKVVSKVTGALGLTADPNAGSGAMGQSNALQARAVEELRKLGVPEVEAQKIVLEQPELVLSSLGDKLDKSEFEDIQTDPRLQQTEMDMLSELESAGKTGFTEEDTAKIEALRSQISGDEKARQSSILQGMAQRGALDSGSQLAAQLSSSQGAADRASKSGIELAGQQASARRGALAQAANVAGQMQGRQFSQAGQKAGAADRIAQFNAAVSQGDTAAKRGHAQQGAQLANQQQMYNKGLIQQKYNNELQKATGMASAIGNQAQGQMQQAGMQANAAQQSAAGMRGLLSSGATAFASDKRLKKDISSADSDALHDMLDKAKPYDYEYKDDKYGKGEQHGLMAQDLEKSELGSTYVEDTPEGKMVDYEGMTPALAAGISDIHKRLKELEGPKGEKYAVGGIGQRLTSGGSGELAGQSSIAAEDISAQVAEEQARKDAMDARQSKVLGGIADAFAEKPGGIATPQIGDINPNSIAAPQAQAPSMLQSIKDRIMQGQQYADGGMNYESGGEGSIIESGEENFAGDELEDRINDGEMVLNLDQQDEMVDLLQELAERRRGDEMVDAGEASVNEPQQETLMAVARGEAMPEDLDPQADIVEPMGSTASDLESLLGQLEGGAYADGGIDYLDQLTSIPGLEQIQTQVPMLPPAEQDMMDNEELSKLAQMEVNEPAPEFGPTDEELMTPAVYDSEPIEITDEKEKPEDKELKSAQRTDTMIDLINNLNNAFGHMDAANPNAMLKPIQKKYAKSGKEDKLTKSRQDKANAEYKKKKLAMEQKVMDITEKQKDRELDIKEAKVSKPSKAELKEKKEMSKNVEDVRKNIKSIKEARDALNALSSSDSLADTGPLDQYISGTTDKGQKLKQKLNSIALDKMVKMFSGMSKAIDSDSERKFFEQSQPNMSFYPDVNKKILDDMITNAESLEKKLEAKMSGGSSSEATQSSQPKSTKPSPGDVVVVKGKRYKVLEDGDSLEEIK